MFKKGSGNYLTAAVLLGLAVIACFAFPWSGRYTGTDILSNLQIPPHMSGWTSRDLTGQLDLKEDAYNFLGHVFARRYTNASIRKSLAFFVFDANNFHHPQVCFSSSGYEVKPLEDMEIDASGRRFKAHMLFMKKKDASLLVVYWISIDKKITDWTQQKIQQFFYSIFNKKKTGLMGRLDIPAREESLQEAVRAAKDFIPNVSRSMPPEDADYLFGAAS